MPTDRRPPTSAERDASPFQGCLATTRLGAPGPLGHTWAHAPAVLALDRSRRLRAARFGSKRQSEGLGAEPDRRSGSLFRQGQQHDRPEQLAAGYAGGRRIVERAGYVNGYLASYLNVDPPRWHHISSAAFVFRRAEGAKVYLAWFDKQFKEHNAAARRPVDLGDAGWIYVSSSRDRGTGVVWRFGRVVAFVNCEWMIPHRALALSMARKQQRRIAAALP